MNILPLLSLLLLSVSAPAPAHSLTPLQARRLGIPHDTRPFQARLEPGQRLLMAGSLLIHNGMDHPAFVEVQFFLKGGWHLTLRNPDESVRWEGWIEQGSVLTVRPDCLLWGVLEP